MRTLRPNELRISLVSRIFILFLLTPIFVFAQIGLLAHWKLDEGIGTTAVDSVNSFIGELINDTVWNEEGKYGSSSLYFDGEADYVQTNLLDELKYANGFTLCAWFNTSVTEEGQHIILWIGKATENGFGVDQECHLTINHFTYLDKVDFDFGDGYDTAGARVNIISDEDFTDTDHWHHLAGVIKFMEGDTSMITVGELYLDGEWVIPMQHEYPSKDTVYHEIMRDKWDTALRFGVPGVIENRNFIGMIDDIQIYDRPLTKEEIAIVMTGETVTSVKEKSNKIPSCYLADNYPNPFNAGTIVSYSIPQSDFVDLTVFDILGKKVQQLVNEFQQEGLHSVQFKTNGLPSGVYFYQLKVGINYSEMKKMVLVQ